MSSHEGPSDAPPSYNDATAAGSSGRPQTSGSGSGDHLQVPGIPSEYRRSMEDEQRMLPQGWVRSYDPTSNHQFFVDTSKDPPRSIWTHPYDDDEYLASLSSEERERIEQQSMGGGHGSDQPSRADLMHAHSDDDDEDHHAGNSSSQNKAELPPRPKKEEKLSFGRKMKDKLTGTTHQEREKERAQRAEAEHRAYQQHLKVRQAMSKAAQTGEPQLVGKDRNGQDVYVEPPQYRGGYDRYGRGAYGYNPYGGGYAPPRSMYGRPAMRYGRGYGGYGGGYGGFGMPLALGAGGGLLGGMLIGDMMGGGMGMGGMGMGMGGGF